MEALDPLVVGLFGKIIVGVIVVLIAIGFVPGVVIGWFAGRVTKNA